MEVHMKVNVVLGREKELVCSHIRTAGPTKASFEKGSGMEMGFSIGTSGRTLHVYYNDNKGDV